MVQSLNMGNNFKHQYNWRHGIDVFPSEIGFDKPLLQHMQFVDLLTGETYTVHSVEDGAVQTFASRKLTEAELVAIRAKTSFKVDDFLGPKQIFQILESQDT